ncbi:MAG: CDP-alcohol phosphatidyltransferase family protein [Thermoplasmata archaeon]|nr:MAG: CDP-alcohol phosphatidyltransferase family protein [Thermoplasmata archaeon]
MGILRLISVADILTAGNAICGVLAIWFLYWLQPDITIGSSLIIIAIIFDGLDGLAARKFGTKHDYGKYLDSIADAISFGLAPAFLFFIIFSGVGERGNLAEVQIFIVSVATILIAGCAVYRLIKFSMEGFRYEYFAGLATPAFAFLIVITAHVLDPHRSENDYMIIPFFASALILFGNYLLISNVKYPKVRGRSAVYLASAFILALLSLMLIKTFALFDEDIIYIYYRTLSIIALITVAGYVILGPVYLWMVTSNKSSEKTKEKNKNQSRK